MNKREILRKGCLCFLAINALIGFIQILQGKIEFFSSTGIAVLAVVVVLALELMFKIIDQIKFLKQYKLGKDANDEKTKKRTIRHDGQKN